MNKKSHPKCLVGKYAHSSSEYADLSEDLEVDGCGDMFNFIQYNFCPICGKNLISFWILAHKPFRFKFDKKKKILQRVYDRFDANKATKILKENPNLTWLELKQRMVEPLKASEKR